MATVAFKQITEFMMAEMQRMSSGSALTSRLLRAASCGLQDALHLPAPARSNLFALKAAA
jgi:hypothetical protein